MTNRCIPKLIHVAPTHQSILVERRVKKRQGLKEERIKERLKEGLKESNLTNKDFSWWKEGLKERRIKEKRIKEGLK